MTKTGETLINLSSLERMKGRSTSSDRPQNYDGIRLKRMMAYIVDVVCIFIIGVIASTVAALIGIITFGLLSPILVICLAVIPLAYHTLTIGSHWHATLGMKLFDLEVCLDNGDYPDYATAFFHAGIFYVTMAITSSLILILSLFNARGRLLHDYLTNSIVRLKEEA